MNINHYLLILIIYFAHRKSLVRSLPNEDSLIVSSTESSNEIESSTKHNTSSVNPQIYSLEIHSNITNRFAKSLVTSKVKNVNKVAAETTFSIILPENAFISEFEMEIGGKIYKAYVKEKREAKQIYQEAVSRGQSAGHVEMSARDSKKFTVSVNIEPESKTIFRLTYEELLQRQDGQYELVINIHPGQIIDNLDVQVFINESRPLTFVRTPSLRTGNEIIKNKEDLDPSSEISVLNSSSATVKFIPDKKQQKLLAEGLGNDKENGISGQFVVQYDVERDPHGGEVLVRDGYFVHFFAPADLKPLPKHIVFVLDHSGSMSGRKIEQLVEAMQNILPELRENDLFNIVRFSDEISIWNIEENNFSTVHFNSASPEYGHLEPHLKEMNLPQAVEGSTQNIQKAREIIKDSSNLGLTNIIGGLEIGLFLIKRVQEKTPDKYQPMIIFLTDGYPNVGLSNSYQITETVTELNSKAPKPTAIFSLSFGEDADKQFLQSLSSRNFGFSRHIYEASDASLQLENFYKKISSPLLTNVTFKYVDGVSDVTKTRYPILFNGSELIVAGRINEEKPILLHVNGMCITGNINFTSNNIQPVTSLERLWAYLTVKQTLEQRETADNKTELTKKALDLALKYSFVTSVTSLVVVKPNTTDSVGTERADQIKKSLPYAPYGSVALHSSVRSGLYPISRSGLPGPRGIVPQAVPQAMPQPYSGAHHFQRPLAINHKGSYSTSSPLFALNGNPHPTTNKPLQVEFRTESDLINEDTPLWLNILIQRKQNITTSDGTSYILRRSGIATVNPECSNAPNNSKGVCKIIFDCPEIFPILTDINVYLNHFCPVNLYAGVCCPLKNGSN